MDEDVAIRVAKIFLERAQNRASFRIRAVNEKGRTVSLSIPAPKLEEFRKMVEAFHEWQKRGWEPEGPETPSKVSTVDPDDMIQPEVRAALRREMEKGR